MLPAKKQNTPTACLEYSRDRTYCGRNTPSDEFVFKDADYAAQNYAASNVIRVCADCMDRYNSWGKSGAKKFDVSHQVTRGLNDK